MYCKKCADEEVEVLKICQPNNVKFICKNGHTWYENYLDKGGPHKRPPYYRIVFEDTLFPEELDLYKRVLKEVKKNMEFFSTACPEDITNYLIKDCNFNKEEVYGLFKKITEFNKSLREGEPE